MNPVKFGKWEVSFYLIASAGQLAYTIINTLCHAPPHELVGDWLVAIIINLLTIDVLRIYNTQKD